MSRKILRSRQAGRTSSVLGLPSVAWLAMVGALGLGACTAPEPEGSTQIEARVVQVREVAERSWYETLDLSAQVLPRAAVTLASEVSGRVSNLPVDEGDRVDQGQVVARLDSADAQARLAQAQARVASAKATLAQSKKDIERGRSLASGDGLIAEDELDRLELALEMARSTLLEAEAGLLVARESVADTILKAPFAGVIGERKVEIGSWVAPGQALLRVIDSGRVKVRGAASQRDRVRLEIGTPVEVHALALADLSFRGAIRLLGQEADEGTGTYRVEAEVPSVHDESSARLLPGMDAVLSIELAERTGVVIPKTAVLGAGAQASVFVVEGGIARYRSVTIEALETGEVVVLSGLAPGDMLVVRGQHGLEDGAPVDVGGS